MSEDSLFSKYKKGQAARSAAEPAPAAPAAGPEAVITRAPAEQPPVQPAPVIISAQPDPELLARLDRSEKMITELRQELSAHKAVPPPPPPPPVPYKELLARQEGSEKMIADLRQELSLPDKELLARQERSEKMLADLRQELSIHSSAPIPPPVVITAAPDKELVLHLERSEKIIAELRGELASQRELFRSALNEGLTREDLKKADFKIDDVAGAVAKLKGGILDQAADFSATKRKVEETLKDFEDISRRVSGFTSGFAEIEHSCRLALGEVQGCVKQIARKAGDGKFDQSVRESVARLQDKIAGLEKALYAGLGDLSGRLMADEVLYRKIFSEAEERVKKGLAPEMMAVANKFKELEGKVGWLTEEYDIVMKRKIRALEAKYSAYEAISVKLDAIGEAVNFENKPKNTRK